jgi:D-alanyl-D-alanine carboxypeptidase
MRKYTFLLVVLILFSFLLSPTTAYAQQYSPSFDLKSESAYLVNLDTGDVLYEKEAQKKVYMAHINMLMTAIVAYEQVEDLYAAEGTYRQYMQDELYNKTSTLAGLVLGETLSIRKLISAMMLQSANDAAMMIADYVGDGSIDAFVEMMNQKAQETGLQKHQFHHSDRPA